ncbi:hypothetical protein KC19_5G010400 [Ceratodon purpureus]|uniref:Uncharacterized protein n=2 Tax=Ceratodon purpureus TaxID=3225 RepID=A0A8T0HWN1_CERPU|nr:hypothetical protein KC19_5G010400 [Ceratodon purpureus]
MAALQLRVSCARTHQCYGSVGGFDSEVLPLRDWSRLGRSSTRQDLVLVKGSSWVRPLGSASLLRLVPVIGRGKTVSASLATDALAASADGAQRFAELVANAAPVLVSRVCVSVQELPLAVQVSAAAVGLMVFALWCLDAPMRFIWESITKKDSNWEKSQTRVVLKSYIRPLMLWAGTIMMCRALDSVELPSEASIAIKKRLTHFVRSLSTVSVFALCAGSLIQQVQKHLMKRSSLMDSRSVSLPFIANAVSTSVWVAAVCLFLELLGFSTHRWLAAGGFGTVLLTLAGREIFTNFLSSMMIHATKPFVESEWIQTKIEGQEVIGTVEHVGWWSPTVIRGDDREAVLIPNHKFSVSVVRNLTQKTHWRIKTHIAINHHDMKKINKIVADMRKVIANHPEIEQKRLHRRVFFDYVNSQNNLALMIMISCFVKTSRFEKYLRVKEGVLLDLLRVVSVHGGRLATPIRSMQRHVEETEPRPVRYDGSQGRPILVNALSSKAGEDDQKPTSEQKSHQKKQPFKESTQGQVETQTVTVTVATDTKDPSDSLSKWKAMKNMSSTQVSASVSSSSKARVEDVDSLAPSRSSDSAPGSSVLDKPQLVKESDDVKEPDNRRLESKSERDVT